MFIYFCPHVREFTSTYYIITHVVHALHTMEAVSPGYSLQSIPSLDISYQSNQLSSQSSRRNIKATFFSCFRAVFISPCLIRLLRSYNEISMLGNFCSKFSTISSPLEFYELLFLVFCHKNSVPVVS